MLKAIRDLAAALHVPHHDDPAVLLNVRDNNKGRQSRGSSHWYTTSTSSSLAVHIINTVQAVHNIVARRLSRESLAQLREVTVQLSLEDFPLGFETGGTLPYLDSHVALTRVSDPVLDRAATVLRMLYVNDLRHLQTKINDLIATMQVRPKYLMRFCGQ